MIEAVLLTGGRSVRMGRDKASLPIEGERLAVRIVRLLSEAGVPTTVLGREPVEGARLLRDDEHIDTPLDALRRFRPSEPLVFVLSCDLPKFDAGLVNVLAERIEGFDAVAPYVDGFRQPLVALYRASAFDRFLDADCPMSWLKALNTRLVDEAELLAAGIHPDGTRGANTPEELSALVGAED